MTTGEVWYILMVMAYEYRVTRRKNYIDVIVLLTPKIKKTLRKLSYETGKSQSEIVREALMDYFRRQGVWNED